MILVTLRSMSTPAERDARTEAIAAYRGAAAFHRALAEELEAGCSERPCAEAAAYRRLARIAETQAWLEEHDPAQRRPA